MKEVKVVCFQCGETVSLETARKKHWYVNLKSKRFAVHRTTNGDVYNPDSVIYSGTCPDCLKVQHEADDKEKFERYLKEVNQTWLI
jgi:hypothetical protein